MSDDERIDYERPLLYEERKPLLYLANGTPLKRQMGFHMQTTGTNPPLHSNTSYGGKKAKGKKGK